MIRSAYPNLLTQNLSRVGPRIPIASRIANHGYLHFAERIGGAYLIGEYKGEQKKKSPPDARGFKASDAHGNSTHKS